MKLKISSQLSFPVDAVTQTFSILAKRRVGKTYCALVMAEEFIGAKIPFVFLDPLGAAWGLRSSLDGKEEGFPVFIIGGSHGDVPLEPTAGKVVADLVVDNPGYYIVDMSLTNSNAEQDRFAMEFAERLYRRKEQARFPLHLFIDEADSFIPQRPLPGQQRMLGAYEAIVRRGGIRGLGITLITQRPAVLNKNVLTQTECLIVLQMTAPQDQDAIDDWVRRNGTKEQRDQMMSALASMKRGEAWVWSPGWLEVFQKINIRQKVTFDSSATPKADAKQIVDPKLKKIDLDWLKGEIKASADRAKDNDPAALKRIIADLKRNLESAQRKAPEAKRETVEMPIMGKEDLETLAESREILKEVDQALKDFGTRFGCLYVNLCRIDDNVRSLLNKKRWEDRNPLEKVKLNISHHNQSTKSMRAEVPKAKENTARAILDNGEKLGKCEREILKALAAYPDGRNSNQVAIMTGYSVKSGGFANALARLRTLEYIDRGQPMRITEAGKDFIGEIPEAPTGEEMQAQWKSQLPKCEREILDALFRAHTDPDHSDGLTSDQLAEITGYSARSGGFANALSKLRTLELINRGQPIKASEMFFLD